MSNQPIQKKKRSNYSAGRVRPVSSYNPPSFQSGGMAPSMGIRQTMGMNVRLEQRLVMTPPLAASEEGLTRNAHACMKSRSTQRYELSENLLGPIREYIATEDRTKPYTNVEILRYMRNQGHAQLTLQNLSDALDKLGVQPSLVRLEKYQQSEN